jgi:hypothetical protein
MPTKHEQRRQALKNLIEAAKRSARVRKAAKGAVTAEVEEGEAV